MRTLFQVYFSEGRPTREEVCMAMAKVMALRGTCSRKQVGVVIAKEGRILSTGYNSAPAGMPHCQHECECAVKNSPHQYGGIHAVSCPALPSKVCDVTVHAEINAVVWAARHGISLQDAELFTTYMFCLNCAKVVINAGVRTVYYLEPYHDTSGLELIDQAGIKSVDMMMRV